MQDLRSQTQNYVSSRLYSTQSYAKLVLKNADSLRKFLFVER